MKGKEEEKRGGKARRAGRMVVVVGGERVEVGWAGVVGGGSANKQSLPINSSPPSSLPPPHDSQIPSSNSDPDSTLAGLEP